ncbi:MAG: PLP-dependent transferase [Schleiferiaceae bacterium]|jgi:cystathionine beta-lyase/cystathionine gamma-synthase|nr:PLP-dependent transferase [Schleiferiaceae bacterium]
MAGIDTKTFIKDVLENMPKDWLNLTTHRLDIYNEELAKTEFLEKLEVLQRQGHATKESLSELPTAYDYIRLGHPLSCVLEWTIAKTQNTTSERVISFDSATIPVYAVLRENLLTGKATRINYQGDLPEAFDEELLKKVYSYRFELNPVSNITEIEDYNGSSIYLSQSENICEFEVNNNIDFAVNTHPQLGSIVLVNKKENQDYVSKIQHVRRRETIAMTPANCLSALQQLMGISQNEEGSIDTTSNKAQVLETAQNITGSYSIPIVASSGLSMQYAIVMGLIHEAVEKHPVKAIKIVVPPNCYGGTNDQARRVAATLENVEVTDFPVDGDNDMVQSLRIILDQLAKEDAVPYIIAEIPTNPRVEVPNMDDLKEVLEQKRRTPSGNAAISPVFILDQTFCPNTSFLRDADHLSSVQTIAYVSGSKFPSGGKCTAGYCVANKEAASLMKKIDLHITLCDNEATPAQYAFLAEQMPSMLQRIQDAYKNTREFVNYIQNVMPKAKINFVSEELAAQGFTPSVFSLDLPTKGETNEEREMHKRKLNLQLINSMISEIPNESKYCVSYGQLKGCYWTIPATSTQGTTKEGDKDYIARVAVSPDLDLEKHKEVFLAFANSIK